MSDIYLAVSETPTVVTLTSAVINSAAASSVTVTNTVTVALDANSLSALENVTVTVGAAITGTVTVSNFPATQAVSLASVPTHAISGTVTAVVLAYDESNDDLGELRSYSIGSRGGALQIVGPSYAGAVTANTLPCVPIFGSVTIGSALPAGTNRIGVVTIGAGTVTIGAGTAQIGSVTASISGTVPISISSVTVGNAVTIGSLPAIGVFVVEAVQDGNGNTFGNDRDFPVTGTVAIGAGVAQIGSVTASLAISSTAITSGNFTSLTSATLVPANTARKMATVYNLGAGQLFVNQGASATTLGGGFMVALSSGDFYECPYTTTTLSAIFATAGTASWVSH